MRRYLLIGIVFFILGVGAFIGLQKANPQTFSTLQQKLMNPFKPEVKLRGDMKPFYGSIVNKKDKEIEVKNRDGSVAKILMADETKITGGKTADLKANTTISGVGKINEDKSITAKNIQINPTSLNTIKAASPSGNK
jgi:hypothetical protein